MASDSLTRAGVLTIDLRLNAWSGPRDDGEVFVTLGELAGLARRPRELLRLLRGVPYERVRILQDAAPPSGVQAGANGLAAFARTHRFEVVAPTGVHHFPPAAFLAGASARFATAMPAELARTARLHRRARRVAGADFVLPARPDGAASLAYLRTEPSLRWRGAHVGGAATHTAGVINGFAGAGLDVHVYAAEQPEGTLGVPFTLVSPERFYHLAQWLTLFEYTDRIVAAAAERPVDFVYQRYAVGSYAGLALAHRLRVPLVLEFNGSEIWAERNWGTGRVPLLETLTRLERRNIMDASLVVVVSDVLRDELIEQGVASERVLVNPNGVDVEGLARLREHPAVEWRRRAQLIEAPTVGFIGTFGLWHGVKVLPAMIDAVARRRQDVRWVVIGDGPLHSEVRAEIEARGLAGRVDMPGVVPHEHAVELLAACDVCVSPHVPNPDGTRFFGSPTKLFEYMGLAKAIVASDLEQIGEVLAHGRTGLLCPPGDAEAAADAVMRLLADAELRDRLGAAALGEARERYSWVAHTRRILDALQAPRKAA